MSDWTTADINDSTSRFLMSDKWTCIYCNSSNDDIHNFIHHKEMFHPTLPFHCPFCNKQSNEFNLRKFKGHLNTHFPENLMT